ncbi:MAG: hypothetical protein Q9161_001136 [Pseudevernia consocians]
MSMQEPPSMVLSHANAIGLHWKMTTKTEDKHKPQTLNMRTWTACRNVRLGKSLRKNIRIDTLVNATAKLNQKQIVGTKSRFAKTSGIEAQGDEGNDAEHEGVGHIPQSVAGILA